MLGFNVETASFSYSITRQLVYIPHTCFKSKLRTFTSVVSSPPLTQLPSEKLESCSDLSLPPYPLPPYSNPLEDPSLQPFPSLPPSLPHSSLTTSQPHPLDLSPFTSQQQQQQRHPSNHQTPNPHSLIVPRLSHPPTVTSSQFPISSLSPDQFQQPIQMLNSLQTSNVTPSLPAGPSPFATPSLLPSPPLTTPAASPNLT